MTARFPVDMSLFEHTSHTPSLFTLERSMGPRRGELLDYCIPVNSYFPSDGMMERLQQRFSRAIRYYPASNEQIAQLVGQCFGLDPRCLVMFNGATELLSWLNQLLIRDRVLIPVPTFGRWTDVPKCSNRDVVLYRRRADNAFRIDVDDLVAAVRREKARTLVLCNPNNPTGACLSRRSLVRLLDELRDLPLIVIDESFLDFCDLNPSPSVSDLAMTRRNLIVMKSLGKNLGLHGIRLGCSISHPDTAARLRAHVPYWNINAVAELTLELLPDHLHEYHDSRRRVIADREYLREELTRIPGLEVTESHANFVYCRLPQSTNGDDFRSLLLQQYGCLIRHCGNKIGSDCNNLRIVARASTDTDRLVSALRTLLLSPPCRIMNGSEPPRAAG